MNGPLHPYGSNPIPTIQEPEWLREARRRNAPYRHTIPDAELTPAVRERRALLNAYDGLLASTPVEPQGDGGIGALERLADYCREAGHSAALANIRAAAHNLGWCIDSGGVDKIDPTVGICPLCHYDSTPQPGPSHS